MRWEWGTTENRVPHSFLSGFVGTLLSASLLTLATEVPAFAQEATEDTVATSAGDLVIDPIHHAAMTLTWNGKTILVDPAPPPAGGEADVTAEYLTRDAPDLILVTDIHPDHLNVEILNAVAGDAELIVPQAVADQLPDALKAKATVMANGDSATVDDIDVEAVPMYNTTPDRLQYHEKGRGNGYVLTLGDTRVYIAGDTEDIPEMRALADIAVAFIPMNLPYTMDINQAADAVKAFRPKITYPYHYGDSDVNAFKELVGDASDVRLLKWY